MVPDTADPPHGPPVQLPLAKAAAPLRAMAGLDARRAVHLAFVLAVAMLLAMGWAQYDALRRSRVAAGWVSHTHRVLLAIGDMREAFATAESAQRGYLLSGTGTDLMERDRAVRDLRATMQSLRELVSDNEAQGRRLRALEILLDQRTRLAQQEVQARSQQGFATPWPPEAVQAAATVASGVDEVTRAMEQEEMQLLQRRRTADEARQGQVLGMLGLALVAGLALLIPAYGGVLYQARQRRRAERRMADMVEALPLTVWQIRTQPDGHRDFVFASGNAQKDRGLSIEAIKGDINNVINSVLEEDRPGLVAAMGAAEQTLQGYNLRYRIRMPTGEVRWIHSSATLHREPDGVILWSGYWVDVTAQEKLQRELVAANGALESFSYSVSHDLRAPLAAIDGFSQALSELHGAALDERGRHYLRRIRHGASQMGELIDGMLLLGQVSKADLRQEPVDLGAMAAALLAELRERDPGRAVKVDIAPDLHAFGDPRLLRQMLANLLGNAWKFSTQAAAPAIEVGRTLREGRRCFYVRDNGAGFDMAYAGRLFGVFQRLHAADEFPGTGVGLATVQRILARHQGEIWAESSPGQGATFFFTIAGTA